MSDPGEASDGTGRTAPTGPQAGSGKVTTSDGVDIAIHDFGDAGPPIVFAHATGFHGLVWQPVAELLAEDFHGISVDHRGHGDSARPSGEPYDWRGFGRDILAAVDGLGVVQPFGVGHSAGGTSMLLAEQARPGTFRALFLYEPVIIAVDPPLGRDPANWLAEGARRRRDVFDSKEQAFEIYSSKPPFATWAREALAAYVGHGFRDRPGGGVTLKCRPHDEAQVYEMATDHDGFARLAEVKCPVMLVGGAESDSNSPVSTVGGLAAQFVNGRSQLLPGLGHFGPMEDPATVAASIRTFFRAVIAGAA